MKSSTLNTSGLHRIAINLARLTVLVDRLIPEIVKEATKLEKNHRNIVAAHKAHRTMAKQSVITGYQPTQTRKRHDPPRCGSGVPR